MSYRAVIAAVAAAAILGAASASCNLVAGLDKIRIAGEGGGGGGDTTCNVDAQCDDQNPCTADSCGDDKLCVHGALDGVPAPGVAQEPGDCVVIQCAGGEPAPVADDADVGDDGEDCTTDACSAGKPTHAARPDGTACTSHGAAGSCEGGVCSVECVTAGDCASSNPCVTPTCDGSIGKCLFVGVPDGTPTPGAAQPAGDCHARICVGGVEVDDVDDSDVPATPTDCDLEACSGGVPANPPKPKGSACSTYQSDQPGFCDGAGTCVACTADSQCPGPAGDCQYPVCAGSACAVGFAPAGTAISAQMAGDCQKIVCDGAGGTMSITDNTDLPDDGNACTTDTCTAGAPGHGVASNGTSCGAGMFCFSGACVGCTSNAQCTPPSTCGGGGKLGVCGCTPKTCAQLGQTCGVVSDGCGGSLDCDDSVKDGTETDVDCGGASCSTKCANGKKCSADSDCTSGTCADGVCCSTACNGLCVACSAAKKGAGADGVCGAIAAGTDPDAECGNEGASSCGTNGLCDGAGACQKYAAGTVCVAASCMGSTYVKQKVCDGAGTCLSVSPSTQSCIPYACSAGCLTSCGTANAAGDASCASGYYCDGVGGGACQPDKASGVACSRSGECQSGFCFNVCL